MSGQMQAFGMLGFTDWMQWRFELVLYYDRPVAAANRAISSRDFLLCAWQVRTGSVVLDHGSSSWRAGPGDWVLIPPGVTRRHRFTSDAAIRSIRCVVVDAACQAPGVGLPPVVIAGGDANLDSAADRLALVAPCDRDLRCMKLAPMVWGALQAAVIVWCTHACARAGIALQSTPGEARVVTAQRLLRVRPRPAAIPWAELRAATGLSRPQLDRLFKLHCGGSVRSWAEDRLLADAGSALRDLGEPVKAVADRLGFGDSSHFCRWFRQRTGATPADWRRRGAT